MHDPQRQEIGYGTNHLQRRRSLSSTIGLRKEDAVKCEGSRRACRLTNWTPPICCKLRYTHALVADLRVFYSPRDRLSNIKPAIWLERRGHRPPSSTEDREPDSCR